MDSCNVEGNHKIKKENLAKKEQASAATKSWRS
jgi:hypothetical protein